MTRDARFRASAGLAALAGAGSAFGQDAAPATPPQDNPAVDLDTIVVTGTRIRRVDTETASPVLVVDRATIEKSGVTTVGDLVQELPSVSGAATNPRVNDGGGSGASVISLRGLGEQRTLVLLNGRRLTSFTNGTVEGVDINAIPLNLIERVEILKEGASAIYGSDAIGGVVNFITRKDYNGGDISWDYGESSHSDGQRQGVQVTWGTTSDKANILLGANYNKQKSVSAGDRGYSRDALYLYGGVVTAGGSSRTPNGFINLPAGFLGRNYSEDTNGDGVLEPGCSSGGVTRIDGRPGTSRDDFRCFESSDAYNYQPLTLLLTPQERIGLFTVSSVKLNDKVEAYAEAFYNDTKSAWKIAPLPLDAHADNITISEDSIYNPFHRNLGAGYHFNSQFRLEALGNREDRIETSTGQINLGLRGDVPMLKGWRWDAGGSWGRNDQKEHTSGYLYSPSLQAAVGPSFIAGDGTPTCGTVDNPIADCTPLNIFNLPAALADPAQKAQFDQMSARYGIETIRTQRIGTLNLNGGLFQLPGGQAQLAVGFEFRDQKVSNDVDFLAQGQPPDYIHCRLQQETCTNATQGKLTAREYYAELFLPLLGDREYAKALNLILGARYSDYSKFGDTTNGKVAIEYRPIDDLLLRGSYAEVFRAPTITDLYLSITASSPTYTDPCTGLTSADLADTAHRPFLAQACENVPVNDDFSPDNGQVTGRIEGNGDLKPEQGHVWTYGFVYDPGWLKGVSMTVDFWQYKLNDVIEPVDVNTVSSICVQTGTYCDLIHRADTGQVDYIDQPILNLGTIKLKGVDIGLKYRTPATDFGRFLLSSDVTYLDQFTRTTAGVRIDEAGQYSRQDGNFARVRGLSSVTWNIGPWESMLTWRYIHGFTLKDADGHPVDLNDDGTPDQIDLHLGSTSYFDASVGYDLPQWHAQLLVGVENLAGKDPPLLYQATQNANTDVETFDTIGRFFYGRVSFKF